MADSPWTFATPRGNGRQEWGAPPLDPFRLPSPVHLPVFPWEASETRTSPAVPIPQHRGRLAEAQGALPSLPRLMQRRDDVLQAPPLVPLRQRFDTRFEPVESLGGHFPSTGRLPPRQTAPEETAVLGAVDGALLRMHLALQAVGNTPPDTGHDPFPGAPTPHVAMAIIGLAAASVPAALQLLLQCSKTP